MGKLTIELDEDSIVDSVEEIQKFVDKNFGVMSKISYYTRTYRDMTHGWDLLGNVKTYDYNSDGPYVPGVYALVYDADNTSTNPVTEPKTILFGESSRAGYKRIITHTGALKGTTTNMSDKWRKHMPTINQWFNTSLGYNLDKVKIYFRPHRLTDQEWEESRDHSVWMETSCHAQYYLFNNHFPPGNTRDLPTQTDVDYYEKLLAESGHQLPQKKD